MKKLKVKVFFTIFIILSAFLLGVLVITNVREITVQKNSISNVLTRNNLPKPPSRISQSDDTKQIFMDYNVYTILLDSNGEYKGLINRSRNELENKDEIIEVAKKIIANRKEDIHISNFLTEKYSYSFNDNSTLTLIDNSYQNSRITKYLITSTIMFVLLEVSAYLISTVLTNWITRPVEESFEREKRFLADASHELKTPIAVIMASADAYENDKDKKWITNIKSESDRMNKLVKDLLDLAKLENNKEMVLNEENISKIVESSVLTFESLFYDQDIKLKYDIKENLKCKCNQDSIKELISILIDNAIKYSDKKGNVKINLYKDNNDIILEVINKGVAIKEEDKEKIFDRFYKVDSSRNRKSNNYGLGLSIAKKIVELHNGTIEANSKDGYTTFKVVLSQK